MIVNILLICIIVILLTAAFLFTILPLVVPGIIFTIAAALILVFWKGMAALGIWNLAVILLMGVLYFSFDWLGGALGAKKFGGSKYGVWGAIIGGILGIPLGGLPGVILGTVIGAAVFELLFNKEKFGQSLKIGFGAGLGFVLGTFGKVILVIIATISFVSGVWK
ncbi:MAG: DUF456 domain-containing protein [Candidatus Portnoybacteria bacterium]|nr:DUF456 domain-containing protein [Candidatus Portnoybacteria bacterium]MDD4983129.1 DUF456 domain-containing protein [Candidatus Portnoybacteria bacterium]